VLKKAQLCSIERGRAVRPPLDLQQRHRLQRSWSRDSLRGVRQHDDVGPVSVDHRRRQTEWARRGPETVGSLQMDGDHAGTDGEG
jgi:hypothetical protein